jgi:hypothetical protein
MIRSFTEQFEPETAIKIQDLLHRIEKLTLPLPEGASRYYAVDLCICLRSGALLGALHIASSLLETVVREMVIAKSIPPFSDQLEMSGKIQQALEDKRDKGFKQLVIELEADGLFDHNDARIAKDFYNDVRIPIHHGLPSRFVNKADDFKVFIDELFGYVTMTSMHDFESIIERKTLILVETVIKLLERNSKAIHE